MTPLPITYPAPHFYFSRNFVVFHFLFLGVLAMADLVRRKAARIVTHVMADLEGRRGFGRAFADIDQAVLAEILSSLVDKVVLLLEGPA